MRKNGFWNLLMLLVLGILVLGAAIPAMADSNSARDNSSKTGIQGNGQGQRAQTMVKAVADLSKMDINQIRAERQSGKSLLEIAQAHGVNEGTLTNKIMAENGAKLKARLDAGTITQAQYDSCKDQMQSRIKERLSRTDIGKGQGQGAGQGPRTGQGQCGNCRCSTSATQ